MSSSTLTPGAWVRLDLVEGDLFRVRALADEQAVELVAHDARNPTVRLSTLVTALAENVHRPPAGTRFWSQDYTPLFRLVNQTNDRHDMHLEACNPWLNRALFGATDDRSCWTNFRDALQVLALGEKWIPYPLGLFREGGVLGDRYELLPATSARGDEVLFAADVAIVVIASACPVSSPAGAAGTPTVEIECRGSLD
jgi:uncharacterized protein